MCGIINHQVMAENIKMHLALLVSGTLLSAFSVASIIFFSDPKTAGNFTHSFLYLSLFLFWLGLFTLIGILIRRRLNSGLYITSLKISTRQAFLISLLITVSLALKAQDLLFWWVEAGFVLLLIVIELFANVPS